MKFPRFYVRRAITNWLVLDHDKLGTPNHMVARFTTRREARAHAKMLNDEQKRDRNEDQHRGERI